ncbi:4-hydroxy-3-methylbut-2-enyl diphosphate reductase, partial [Candidatus Woesearchaeota archaeon]|nr:4-hydroxy-3-methylbut-2-enyl diphosphate reductase [Candidatus Woesearchaeota archaeon]
MPVQKVILVSPRGFCAGVDRAIKVVEECLALFGKPVYVKHQIVHNRHVVEGLEKKGAFTVENLDEVPEGSVVVFSAHGSPPEHYRIAKERKLRLIDATCPLVTKVHLEAVRFARQGYKLIYIGHKNHVEGIGVLGELPGEIPLVESVEDVNALEIGNPEKLIYLTQTTLSVDEASG